LNTEEQLSWSDYSSERKKNELVILCDSVELPANAGAILRLADAFAIKEVVFCGNAPSFKGRKLKKVSRDVLSAVQFRHCPDICEAIIDLKKNNYSLIALEITNLSKDISFTDFSQYKRLALIVGGEAKGISRDALEKSELSVHIPMKGQNLSMNLSNALAIALYEISKQIA